LRRAIRERIDGLRTPVPVYRFDLAVAAGGEGGRICEGEEAEKRG
jgi:hypothetical protein